MNKLALCVDEKKGSCSSRMNSFCQSLDSDDRFKLCESCKRLFVEKGGCVLAEQVAPNMVILNSGALAVMLPTEQGKSRAFFLSREGSVLNIMRIAGSTSRFDEAFNDGHMGLALADCEMCAVPLNAARALFKESNNFAWAILSRLSDSYKSALVSLADSVGLSGVEMIVKLLGDFEDAGIDPADVTHQEMADMLCMNRVSVTRLMGKALDLHYSKSDR